MNTISLNIIPNSESNDHQVRIFIDNADWLGEDSLGIDPPNFFQQKALFSGGNLLAGRCSCGCEGCDDVFVDVQIDNSIIKWKDSDGLIAEFDKDNYLEYLNNFKNDYSWEDENRKAERLVDKLLNGISTIDNYKFQWSSARINQNSMTLSFMKDQVQKLLEFKWNGISAENALMNAELFKKSEDIIS